MICVPIIAKNTEDAVAKMMSVEFSADLYEIRLDLMESFDLHDLIQASPKPLLVTYRSKREGGEGSIDPESQTNHLLEAIKEGVDLIDVELSLPRQSREKIFSLRGKSRIVVSVHNQETTPSRSELESILLDCHKTGADVVKIVTMARTWEDNFRVLELISRAKALETDVIAFCMGPMGRVSRILAPLMGGYMTFASLETGQESAPGQIPVDKMKNLLEFFKP